MANWLFSMALGETQGQIVEANPSAISELPAGEIGIFIGGSVAVNKQVSLLASLETAIRYCREQKYDFSLLGSVATVSVNAPGSGYTVSDTLTLAGGSGSGLTVDVATITNGVVDGVTIAGGGTGYTVNDVLTLSGGSGSGLTLTVTSVSGGVIDGVSITTAGSGYTASDTGLTCTGGTGGDDATFDISSVIDGRVATATVNAAGSGYTASDTGLTATGGTGSSATFDVASIVGTLKVCTIEPDATRTITFADGTALDATAIQVAWDDTFAATTNASLMFDKTLEQLERYVRNWLKNRVAL